MVVLAGLLRPGRAARRPDLTTSLPQRRAPDDSGATTTSLGEAEQTETTTETNQ
jgi:hypothetical protein